VLLSTARILELSLAANIGTELLRERQTSLENMTPSFRRQVSSGLLKLATARPELATSSLNKLARLKGLRYLGCGVEFSAYADTKAQEAVKVHRASATFERPQREKLAIDKSLGHGLLYRYLGRTILDQRIDIREHVLGGGYETLQIRQPLVDFGNLDSPFQVSVETVDTEHLEQITRRFPGIDEALREFIKRSRIMYETTDALPDTNGSNNVVAQQGGNVVLLDSTPIGNNHPGVQLLILDQLTSLESGLRAVA
jgi:hypothetical protein